MKLEVALLAGAETKLFLSTLTTQIDRLEKLVGQVGLDKEPPAVTIEIPKTPAQPSPKPRGAPKAAKATKEIETEDDAQEYFDLSASDEVSEAEEAEEAASVITKKDLIAACKAHRDAAIKQLKKMKVQSVDEIKPEAYAKFIAAIKG